MSLKCDSCGVKSPQIRRGITGESLCKSCFIEAFENEVHSVIMRHNVFQRGDRVAVGVSGGKDSSALLHCLVTLNRRFDYGLEILMLAIDEGIAGYRDDSLEKVYLAQKKYGLQLQVLSYKDLYEGWTMDRIVKMIGSKQNCSYCGILRRQALERGSRLLRANKIATGHNADDSIETILMNFLRGDLNRLRRCCGPITGTGADDASHENVGGLVRVKPFYYSCEKEVVLYCHFLQLDYFSTECSYSPNAFRGHVRVLVKDVEADDPRKLRVALLNAEKMLRSLPQESASDKKKIPVQDCSLCGLPCSGDVCQACALVEQLNSNQVSRNCQCSSTSGN